MALIHCPECGKEISDKSTACIHCGFPLLDAEDNIPQFNYDDEDITVAKPSFSDSKYIPYYKACGVCIIIGFLSLIFKSNMLFMQWFLLFLIGCVGALLLLIVFAITFLLDYSDYNLACKDWIAYKKRLQTRENRIKSYSQYNERKKYSTILKIRRENKSKGIPCCPHCGSTRIATINRGFSIVWGFIGSGNAVNVCQACGHKFKPGR